MRAMKATVSVFALAVFLPVAAPSCFAGDNFGRYTITPTGDGFLRLDSATGALSSCSSKSGGWACESVADDVLELKQKIDSLTRETEELRDRLAKAEASLKAEGSGKEPLPASPAFQLPQVALDEMTDFVNEMVRRLQDMVRDLKQPEAEKSL